VIQGSDSATTVAIVTPSFNQARFLRQCLESVLAQTHPAIDYLVVDGGSTDGSLDILRSYGERVRWISEPDNGQSDAIAKGFARTSGDILAWINSDDMLLPGAAAKAAAAFAVHPTAGLVYAHGWLLDEHGERTGRFPWIEPFDLWRLVYYSDYILQPSAFFRRSTFEAVGGLDPSLHFAMDWDLWIRLASAADVVFLAEETLGCSRIWSETKTSTGGWRRIKELSRLARRHTGQLLTPAVRHYALDTAAQVVRARAPRVLFSWAEKFGRLASAHSHARMPLHLDGWLAPHGILIFPRRWRRARLALEVERVPPPSRNRVRVALDGRQVEELRVDRTGILWLDLAAESAGSAFCRLEIRAEFSFVVADGRRVALRLSALEPAVQSRPTPDTSR